MSMMRTDAARLDRAASGESHESAGAAPGSVDDRNADEFTRLMGDAPQQGQTRQKPQEPQPGEREQKGQEEQKGQGEQKDSGEQSAFAGMGNPLHRLFANQMPVEQSAAPVQSAAPPSLADLTDALVDRILVSQPGEAGQEVRIILSSGAVADTEARILRSPDGSLAVTLHTNNASSFQTLVAAQDSLKNALAERETNGVRVEVFSGADREDGSPHKRSRGYMPQDTEA